MISQDVTIPVNGSDMGAYLARPPEESGPHPAVIVLHDIFGYTPEVRRVTDLCASTGYVGLAIDYFHRTHPRMVEPYTEEGAERASEAAKALTADDMIHDVAAAVAWLNEQPFVRHGKIGTWGFSFGANIAFITSSLKELRGAIAFYPTHVVTPLPSGGEPPLEHAKEVAIPLLLLYGEEDYYVSRNDMEQIRRELAQAQKRVHMEIYPNVGHAFFRHGRPEAIAEPNRYSQEAIAQACADSSDLVKAFLAEHLSEKRPHEAVTGGIHIGHTPTVR
jgi:carboxymethylenebutenolidase